MITQFVMARNAKGRPTLMHKVGRSRGITLCGLDIRAWSRVWMNDYIEVLMCKRCKAQGNG